MTIFMSGFIVGLIAPLVIGAMLGVRSAFLLRSDDHETIGIRLSRRIGEMQAAGWPWQRRDLGLMSAARDEINRLGWL